MMMHAKSSRILLGLPFLWAGCAGRDARANAPVAPATNRGPVLVELFTSQGCSSCPPADALVRDLPRLGFDRDRVVPLVFHVDIWDGLGWRDPFASPTFTELQRRYARAGVLSTPDGETGISGVYTPQMIVGGRVHFPGGRRDLALAEIEQAANAPARAVLVADGAVDGERAIVTARLLPPESARDGARPAWPPRDALTLTVALARKRARTTVTRGENSGETLQEAAIVRVLSDPIPITGGADAPVKSSVLKPRDLDWNDVEITAFVRSTANLRVLAARAVTIPPESPTGSPTSPGLTVRPEGPSRP